jgi:hypothetical protein
VITVEQILKKWAAGHSGRGSRTGRAPTKSHFPYRRSIVTFIDVLGFREIVKNRTADEIGAILNQLARLSSTGLGDDEDTDGGPVPPGLAASFSFSDCIVRACPIDTEHQTGAIFHELYQLALTQAELALKGVFLRGGITVGDLYFSGRTLFGPAMVRAYDLESKFAIYPRIVLDPLAWEAYLREPAMWGDAHDLSDDREYVDMLLRKGDDQVLFIDYLTNIVTDHDEDVFTRHREEIIKAASNVMGFSEAKQKYYWLSGYHNQVVREVGPKRKKKKLLLNLPDMDQSE